MSEANYSKDYIDLTHKQLKDSLEGISTIVTEINKKIDEMKDRIKDNEIDTENLYKTVSQDSGRILLLEKLNDQKIQAQAQDGYILRERLFWGVITVLIALLGYLGIIDKDFIRAIF